MVLKVARLAAVGGGALGVTLAIVSPTIIDALTIFYSLLSLLVSGSLFYTAVEGWSLVDSLYFSVMTLSTVGYGDFHPSTTLGKIFTVFYIVVGAGIFVAFITKIAAQRGSHRHRKAPDSGES